MKLDKKNPPETVEFEGVLYRRMGGRRLYYLSQSSSNAGRRRAKGLHVAIWESHSGKSVPPAHEIHHKDGDTFNCAPDNLECLPRLVHRNIPKRVDIEDQRKHLDKYRHLAAAWHGSAAGLEWHREHAKVSLRKPGVDNHPIVGQGTCVWCGCEFTARSHRRKFCGPQCQVQESGIRNAAR